MALIKCKECGKEISDKATACPNCGCPIIQNKVEILFLNDYSYLIHGTCYIYYNNKEIARCKQGEAITLECFKEMEIEIKISTCFGTLKQHIKPGEKYKIDYNKLTQKPYFVKVDTII